MTPGIDKTGKSVPKRAGTTSTDITQDEDCGTTPGNLTGKVSGSGEKVGEGVGGSVDRAKSVLGGLKDRTSESLGGLKDRTSESLGGVKSKASDRLGGLKEGLDDGPGRQVKELVTSGLAADIISGSPGRIASGLTESVAGRYVGDAVDKVKQTSGGALERLRPGSKEEAPEDHGQRSKISAVFGSTLGRARKTLGRGSESVKKRIGSGTARKPQADEKRPKVHSAVPRDPQQAIEHGENARSAPKSIDESVSKPNRKKDMPGK